MQKSEIDKLKAELAVLKAGKAATGGRHRHHHCHKESNAKKRRYEKSDKEKAENEEVENKPTPEEKHQPAKKIKVEEPGLEVCLITPSQA